MPTAEAVMCQCGAQMQPTLGNGLYCENCDQTQPQERFGMDRRTTLQDVRYNMYWAAQESEYQDHRKPDVRKRDPNPTYYNAPPADELPPEGGTNV